MAFINGTRTTKKQLSLLKKIYNHIEEHISRNKTIKREHLSFPRMDERKLQELYKHNLIPRSLRSVVKTFEPLWYEEWSGDWMSYSDTCDDAYRKLEAAVIRNLRKEIDNVAKELFYKNKLTKKESFLILNLYNFIYKNEPELLRRKLAEFSHDKDTRQDI